MSLTKKIKKKIKDFIGLEADKEDLAIIIDEKWTKKKIKEKLEKDDVDYKVSGDKDHYIDKYIEKVLPEADIEEIFSGEEAEIIKESEPKDAENEAESEEVPPKPYWMDPKEYERRKKEGEAIVEG